MFVGEGASDQRWMEQLRFDQDGLIPAVIQDVLDNTVLMVGYMNRKSLCKTVETGQTWFWSRSRQQLWHKGETSGHFQHVKKIAYDCDGDTLLVHVEQIGPACHTGERSCFFTDVIAPMNADETQTEPAASASATKYSILDELTQMISARYAERPEGAYTTYLFEKGLDKILKKLGEETTEVIVAAKNASVVHEGGDVVHSEVSANAAMNELTGEVADLLFHLCVLLKQVGLSLEDAMFVLSQRFGKTHSWQTTRNQ